ncbi:hypothetical protein JFU48_24150 [Pseudomonas sp. TH49]|uniref:hypothetical protein n=1 Tax=Pseudomonas sp. TH49 TaxID=2796413 RepID=UPI0019129318|nr:hypothetical protein [Pseudomonas sp. TH49]MBK5344469.1 hypothetical protein [Pseudomonas sp. TH49]
MPDSHIDPTVNPGGLDPAFGENSSGIIAVPGGSGLIRGLVQDGDAFVCAISKAGEVWLHRILPNGEADEKFGQGGVAKWRYPPEPGQPYQLVPQGLIRQPDGKFLVLATSITGGTPGPKIFFTRFNPSGSPDLVFSTRQVNTPIGHDNISLSGVQYAYAPDGKILIAVNSLSIGVEGYINFTVVHRFLADGAIDTTFGEGSGFVKVLPKGGVKGDAIAVLRDGKILVGGVAANESKMLIACLLPNGEVDLAFGDDGYWKGPSASYGATLLVRDDRIFWLGIVGDGYFKVAVIKVAANGKVDPEFNDGKAMVVDIPADFPGHLVMAVGLIQADGKLVVAGSAGFDDNAYWLRIEAEGGLDLSFGNGGIVTYEQISEVKAIVLDAEANRMVAAVNLNRRAKIFGIKN